MKYSDALNHIKKCPFQYVECKKGCGEVFLLMHKEEHFGKNRTENSVPLCPYAPQECDRCKLPLVSAGDLEP